MESTEPRLIAVLIGVAILAGFLFLKIISWAYHSLFGGSSYANRHESEEDQIARVFFDEREDWSDYRQEISATTDPEEWRKVASYNKAIAGKTLVDQKNVNGDIYGLELDDEYFYLVFDCVKDLEIKKFKLPDGVAKEEIFRAFKRESKFLVWLESNGFNVEAHNWYHWQETEK